jgi:putative ABC transport system permease protein
MSPFMTLVIAIKALRRNALRTALTALGMIIGVAAVIVMTALGSGARNSIETQIQSAGANVITVNAGADRFGPVRGGAGGASTLVEEDVAAIRAEVPGVRYISPGVNTRAQVVSAVGNWNTTIQGVSPEYQDIRAWPVQVGSYFTEQDVLRSNKVVVIGSRTRDEIFGAGADPVGALVRINNEPFRVIGVLTSKGQGAFGQDQDDVVLAPYTTVMRRLVGNDSLRDITISAEDGYGMESITTNIEGLLRARHNIPPGGADDFSVRTQEEIANVLTATTNTMTYLLASIAAVSLLVGGIGIMNIMLVSVTERTREIGLRLSVGARDTDVLLQFLAEAVVLSLAGGAIGVGAGFGASYALSELMQWTSLVELRSVLLSFGCAAAIGIFFGFYPARKAAALDPIDALRYE